MINQFLFGNSARLKAELDSVGPILMSAIPFYPVLGLAFATTVWGHVPSATIIIWYVALCLIVSTSYFFSILYPRNDCPESQLYIWGWLVLLRYALAGAAWGFAGYAFILPDEPVRFMIIAVIITAIAVASINPISSFRPAYIVFVLLSFVPFLVRLFVEGTTEFLLLSFLLVLVLLTMIKSALVTENNKLQQALAIKANQEKSQFIAGASHDLRQPLHSLGLLISSLESRADSADTQPLFFKINASLDNLTQLIDSILDISKLDSQVFDYQKTHVQLAEILQPVHDQLIPMADKKGLLLTIDTSNTVVYTDKLLLGRIVKNLVDNAIRYTSSGTVEIVSAEKKDKVSIRVTDTGPGIPEQEHENVFSEYYQYRGSKLATEEGLGLGLAIVKRLADLLDIAVSFTSSSQHGTAFELVLEAGDEQYLVTKPKDYLPLAWQLNGIKALIIDNDLSILEATSERLKSWGMEVQQANDRSSAMCVLESFSPDLIIADYRLNGVQSGVELLNQITANSETPACGLIISADSSESSLADIKSSGFHFLHKPVNPMLLRRTLFDLNKLIIDGL